MSEEAPESGVLEGLLESSGALQSGHFLLSSGRHSPRYVQCALLLEAPARARRVGRWLAARLEPHGPDSILAPAMGGLLIGHETAATLDVPFRFTERRAGSMELRRGFRLRSGERIAIVEDVVTTGTSTMETAVVARGLGADVLAVASIIDRTGPESPFPFPFESLLSLDFPTWTSEECPLCAEGGTPVKPGSREGAERLATEI